MTINEAYKTIDELKETSQMILVLRKQEFEKGNHRYVELLDLAHDSVLDKLADIQQRLNEVRI